MSAEQEFLVQNNISDAKSGVGIFDLPCGYLDTDGTLHTEIEIREMTGEEEDLLASSKIKSSKRMNGLMSGCINRLGTITDKGKIATIVPNLLIGDRVFILFAIRRVSFGDMYNVKETCEHCNKIGSYDVNLDALSVVKMNEPTKRRFSEVLKSCLTVKYHLPTGADEQAISDLLSDGEELSAYILMRLDEIDGKRVSLKQVKQMRSKDRNELRTLFAKHEGGVDTSMEFECSSCSNVFKKDLKIDAGFFFPSLIQKQ